MKELTRRREVTWEDPMVSAALALDMSGVDYLRAIAGGAISPPPIAVLLGMAIVDVQPGRVAFSLEVGEHLYAHGTTTCLVVEPHLQSRSGGNGHGR
jgi:hypothetical protein